MTRTKATTATITLLIALSQFLVGGTENEADSASLVPTIATFGADAEESARLDDALARFHDNGLALPDLEVWFFDHQGACGGHDGLFQPRFTRQRILICSDLPFVLPHELAHAWAEANLSDDDRNYYNRDRGLTNWNDHAEPWQERGTEDAAFVIQQNLTATHASMTSETWIERAAAYELLTGRTSPLRNSDV